MVIMMTATISTITDPLTPTLIYSKFPFELLSVGIAFIVEVGVEDASLDCVIDCD